MTPLPLVTFLLLLNSVVNAWVVPSSPQKNSMTLFEKARHDQHTEFMEREPGSLVGDLPDLTDDLVLVRSIVKAGDGRKAEEIVGLQVAQVSTLTSYMVFLSGNSRPQNQAIAAAIADQVEEEFGIHKNPQGTADSGWMVLDYGSVMVHIMTPKSRLFYDVEGQVRAVRRLMIPNCIMFIVSHLLPFCSGEAKEASRSIYPKYSSQTVPKNSMLQPIWRDCQKKKIRSGVRYVNGLCETSVGLVLSFWFAIYLCYV